jgi:hypothetical protein
MQGDGGLILTAVQFCEFDILIRRIGDGEELMAVFRCRESFIREPADAAPARMR